MSKGVANKKYTGEFKEMVVETLRKEKLSYKEAMRQFEIGDHHIIQRWERIDAKQDLSVQVHPGTIMPFVNTGS